MHKNLIFDILGDMATSFTGYSLVSKYLDRQQIPGNKAKFQVYSGLTVI